MIPAGLFLFLFCFFVLFFSFHLDRIKDIDSENCVDVWYSLRNGSAGLVLLPHVQLHVAIHALQISRVASFLIALYD